MKTYQVYYDGYQQPNIKAVSSKMALKKATAHAKKINKLVPSHFPKIDRIFVAPK